MKGRFLLVLGIVALALCGLGSVGRGTQVTPACRWVKVVDRSGKPIVGAEVSMLDCDSETEPCTNPIQSRGRLTDQTGRVCADELMDLNYGGALEVIAPERLGGRCAGGKHWPYPKGLPGRGGNRPIVVRLDAPPLPTARLEGRIKSSDGRSIAGATVLIESIAVGDRCSFIPAQAPVKSLANGRFFFAAVTRGAATLHVKHSDFAPRTITAIVPSTDAEIVLDEGASWEGRVLDPDGRPVADCRVSARELANIVSLSPCSEGRFSLRNIPAGEIEVVVLTDERSPLGARTLTTKVRIGGKERWQRDLFWPRGVTLAGVIVDQSGAPVAEARLSALPRGSNRTPSELHPSEVVVRADGKGQFVFRHLPPGRWVIESDLRGGLKGKLDIEAKTDRDRLRVIVPQATGE